MLPVLCSTLHRFVCTGSCTTGVTQALLAMPVTAGLQIHGYLLLRLLSPALLMLLLLLLLLSLVLLLLLLLMLLLSVRAVCCLRCLLLLCAAHCVALGA